MALNSKLAIAALLLCTAAVASSHSANAQGSRSVTFDFLKAGAVPNAFDCNVTGPGGAGRWEVTQIEIAEGTRRVLAQTSQVADANRIPYCLLKGYRGADVDIVVLIRLMSGEHAQAGGLVWRAVDKRNYYVLTLDAEGDRMSVYRVENGHPKPLPIAGADRTYAYPVKLDPARWYQIRVRAEKARFEIFLETTKRFEVEDGGLRGHGAVGIATMQDSVVQFDAFNVAPAR